MRTITGGGSFTRQNIIDLNANFAQAGTPFTPGNLIYCSPANGSLVKPQDGSAEQPFTDLATAYAAGRNGKNDIVLLVGDGTTSASVRPTATVTWAKNALHLVGYAAPSNNTRARIATLSGNTAFATFIKVTATGCIFENFSLFNDNAIANQITWTDEGGRNCYNGVNFGGLADATSAADAGSRILKLGGQTTSSGENLFTNCTFGLDTIARSAANASIEFSTNSKRNVFIDCKFVSRATAATPIYIKSSGTNPLETYQLFVRPAFINQQSGGSGTTLTGVATLAAAGNGQVVLVSPSRFNVTDWGTDATSLAQIFLDGAATGATDDIGRGAVAIAT